MSKMYLKGTACHDVGEEVHGCERRTESAGQGCRRYLSRLSYIFRTKHVIDEKK